MSQGQSHSISLEKPIAHGAQETLSFDKSGVLVQFRDTQSFFSDAQGIRLEICWDVNCIMVPLQSGEVQLSPVIKFHPYGFQISKPVQIKIPHSALVLFSNGWGIKLKSSRLHNESIVWREENLSEVHNNEVSFQVDSLTSYVVIGTSLANDRPTKKRLQSAVFGGEGTVGVDYTAYLYVFDDCEASLEVPIIHLFILSQLILQFGQYKRCMNTDECYFYLKFLKFPKQTGFFFLGNVSLETGNGG